MIYQEAKEAFNNMSKIIVDGRTYRHINAIIFRRHEQIEVIQLELQDESSHNSVTIVKMEKAEVAEWN